MRSKGGGNWLARPSALTKNVQNFATEPCLPGIVLFTFYITIAFDAIRLYLTDLNPWFPFTEEVFYGTIGSLIVYGVMIWISALYFKITKACNDSPTK